MIKIAEMSYLDEYEINKLKNNLMRDGFLRPASTIFFFVKDSKYRNKSGHDDISFKAVIQESRTLPAKETHLEILITVVGYTESMDNRIRDACKKIIDQTVLNKKPQSYTSDMNFNNFEISKIFKLESKKEIELALKVVNSFFKDVARLVDYWNRKGSIVFTRLAR